MNNLNRLYAQQNFDLEVSRALKSYSKPNFPSPNVRKQILMRAALPLKESNTKRKSFLQMIKVVWKSNDENLSIHHNWQLGLRNQYLTLAFCVSTSWRMGI